jgi:hypothetical protein
MSSADIEEVVCAKGVNLNLASCAFRTDRLRVLCYASTFVKSSLCFAEAPGGGFHNDYGLSKLYTSDSKRYTAAQTCALWGSIGTPQIRSLCTIGP